MAQGGGGERRKGLLSYFSSASVEVKHSIRQYRSQLFTKEEDRRSEQNEEQQQKIEQKEKQLIAGDRQPLQTVENEDYTLADLHDSIAQFRLSPLQGALPIDDETQQATGEPPLKAARELYDGIYSTVPAHKALEWLAKETTKTADPDMALVRAYFMEQFDFSGKSPLGGVRMLANRLAIRGESQQIDRVILAYSQRWCVCNPEHNLLGVDTVHTMVYALILLSTDLHNPALSQTNRMTRRQFVSNTVNTIRPQASNHHPTSPPSSPIPSSSPFMAPSWKLSTPATTPGSTTWWSFMNDMFVDMYDSVLKTQLKLPHQREVLSEESLGFSSPQTYSSTDTDGVDGSSPSGMPRTTSSSLSIWSSKQPGFRSSLSLDDTTSLRSANMTSDAVTANQQPLRIGFAQSLKWRRLTGDDRSTLNEGGEQADAEDPDEYHVLALTGAPWAKEGFVRVLKSTHANAKKNLIKNTTLECFAVIENGTFHLFTFDQMSSAKQKCANGAELGGGNWTDNANSLASVPLQHSVAMAMPGLVTQSAWVLTHPTLGTYQLQVGTEELVQEWMNTATLWAARTFRKPLVSGVSNVEYGWGESSLLGNDAKQSIDKASLATKIHEWQAPTVPVRRSFEPLDIQLEVRT